ncbi:MAG: LysR family transcriptional regulator [Pseudomonadota bacterium]
MNWDDLRIFLAIVRAGNLSAAAKALQVTQPTVGRRLRILEEDLGARLFDRLPDGFVPTPAGSDLLPMAEAMEKTAFAVDRHQAAFSQDAVGTVRISVWEIFAQFLSRHLAELSDHLPGIEIELDVTHVHRDLSRREADLLIRECLPQNPGLVARKVASYAFAVYGTRDLVERYPAAHNESRYELCPWIGYDEEHAYFQNQTWLLERLGERRAVVRANDGMVLHELVRQSVGLGVLPCFAGDGDAGLLRLTPPLEEISRSLYLVVHRDLKRSPAVRAVMDALIEIYRRETPRLLGRREAVMSATA